MGYNKPQSHQNVAVLRLPVSTVETVTVAADKLSFPTLSEQYTVMSLM